MGSRPRRRGVRGRTRPGRLSAVDDYLEVAERELVRAEMDGAAFVDIGIGDDPTTTLECAARLRAANPGLLVVGVDVEPGRVRRARGIASHVSWRHASFDWRRDERERAKLVRIMNVLRSYPLARRLRLLQELAPTLVEGALVVEGSTCANGEVVAAQLLRKRRGELVREGVLCTTTFRRGFAPEMFRDRMPRDERRRSGSRVAAFFDAWTAVWREIRRQGDSDPRACFRGCLPGLSSLGFRPRLIPRLGEHSGLVCNPWQPHPLEPPEYDSMAAPYDPGPDFLPLPARLPGSTV